MDSENPDIDFRDWNIPGVPSSGDYRPSRDDAEKWLSRLGLPNSREMEKLGLIRKSALRRECREWLSDNSHRCTPDDIILHE